MVCCRTHDGRFEEAVAAVRAALAIDIELGEPIAAAGDVASLGNLLRNLGRWDEALEVVEDRLTRLAIEDDPSKWVMLTTIVGRVHRELGNVDEALRTLERARDVAIEQRIPFIMGFIIPGIAHIQLGQGNVEASLASYRQFVELSRRMRHVEGLAQALRALGEVFVGLDRTAEAVPMLREAAELFEQLEDSDAVIAVRQRLASACERSGADVHAETAWEWLRAKYHDTGDGTNLSLAYEGLARCARRRGDRSAAIEFYDRAVIHPMEAGDGARESTLRNTLGMLHWENGDHERARADYERALVLCRNIDDHVHAGLILNSLGATLLKLARYEEACSVLETAVTENAETGERRLEAHSHATLGDVLLALGRPADARVAFERSLAMRPPLGDRRGEGWMLQRVARTLRAENREDGSNCGRRAGADDRPRATGRCPLGRGGTHVGTFAII